MRTHVWVPVRCIVVVRVRDSVRVRVRFKLGLGLGCCTPSYVVLYLKG